MKNRVKIKLKPRLIRRSGNNRFLISVTRPLGMKPVVLKMTSLSVMVGKRWYQLPVRVALQASPGHKTVHRRRRCRGHAVPWVGGHINVIIIKKFRKKVPTLMNG